MTFLIRTIDYTEAGREIVRERQIQQTLISVGRSSENDIHLADLSVELYHLTIEEIDGSKIRVVAQSPLGFKLDGQQRTDILIGKSEGGEVSVGEKRLTLGTNDSGSLLIIIDNGEHEKTRTEAKKGFSLSYGVLGKRNLSWAFAISVLLGFLAIPITSHLTRKDITPDVDRAGSVLFDSSWSSGSLSFAHHGLEDNCEACHVDAFVSVTDQTCLTCHEDIGDHAAPNRLASGRAPHSWGDSMQWAVADVFGKEGPGSCTSCHSEHEGDTQPNRASQQFCSDCHESLDTRLSDTDLGNAHDFGLGHPGFKAQIFTEFKQDKARRISLADNPKEVSGLIFPHDIHLDPESGVTKMAMRLGKAGGYGAVLECSDCHTPTGDRITFEQVNMEDNCESCHSLVYDRVGSTFRTLQHGDVDQMLADLRAMDRVARRPIVTGRKRPDRFQQGGLYYTNFGAPRSSLVSIDNAFAPEGVCGECHVPDTSEPTLNVMPVNLPDRYFLNGGFDHHAHRTEECSDCHEAEISQSSEDLLMPDIGSCRECHMGEAAVESEVPSSCAMCHSYHAPSGPVPDDHPDSRPSDNLALLLEE